jgi:outer membrane biosynthesis protein TonB
MKLTRFKTIEKLRLSALAVVTVATLALELTAPASSVQAGFTPTPTSPPPPTNTPAPPTNTPAPPTNTPISPTAAPAQHPKKKKPAAQPTEAEPVSTPSPPLPATGPTGWWFAIALLLWAGSLPLILPMIGPLHRKQRQKPGPTPKRRKSWQSR